MVRVNSVGPSAAVAGDTGTLGAVAGLEIVEELGRGAHAVVYRARGADGEYAVKTARTDVAVDAAAAAALRREAALLACVDHPAVGRVFEVGESGGVPYLVMELIEGHSLAHVLDGGRMSLVQVVRVAVEVAGALAAAHRVGVVHRDVKPDNILIPVDGRPKLVDFGLATQGSPANSGEAAGTFAYAAPEQTGMLARPVDGRADLYALGVVIFECLSGVKPFNADDAGELIRLHAVGEVPDVSALRDDVPPALAAIVSRLLAKDPDDRYQDGVELSAALGGVSTALIGSTGDTPPAAVQARRPVVGRAPELARLRARWDQARLGTGGVARVSGPSGSGKTLLVGELCAGVLAAGHPVLTLSGAADSAPLAPLRSALERHVHEVQQMPDAQRDRAVDRMRSAAGAGASVLQILCPALTEVLRAPKLADEDRQDQLAVAAAAYLLGLADAAGGLVVCVDDAHQLDSGSVRVLRHLLPVLRQHPLLVVTTELDDVADGSSSSWTAGGGRAGDILVRLKPLDQAGVTALVVTQLGGGVVSEHLAAQLTGRSGGNALAALEYLRAMLDAAVIQPHWGTWVLNEHALDRLVLPADVLDLVVARADGLPAATRRILTAAAAIGTPFRPDLLAAVCRVDLRTAVAAVEEGLTHAVLEARAGAYAFLHHRVNESLLAELSEPQRRSLHQRIAEVLEEVQSDDPAHHYVLARHYRDGEAGRTPDAMFRACCTAAQTALNDQAPEQALEYLQMARTAADAGCLQPDSAFFRACGLAELRVGRLLEAQASLEQACLLEPDPLRRGELLGLVAEAQHSNYASTESVATIRRALAEIGAPLPANPLTLAISTVLMFVAGVLVRWTGRGFATVTGAQRDRYRVRAALYTTGAMGAAVGMQRMLSLALQLRCLYLVNRLGPGPEYARLQAGLGLITAVAGWRRRSRRCYERAYAAAEASGDPRLTATVAWTEATGVDAVPGIGATTGNSLRSVLQEHGRWLGLPEYLGAVACLGAILAYRGYAHEAAAWFERGRERMEAAAAVPGNPIAMLGVITAVATGKRALTDERLSAIRDLIPKMEHNAGQRINLLIAAAIVGAEQGDETVLDTVSEQIRHRRVTPRRVWPQQRSLWLYLAWGRLGQCRTATAERRADLMTAAQRAVTDLGRAADTPGMKAYHQAAQAEYLHLQGDADRALRHLARAEVLGLPLDLPLLSCHIASTRARIMRTLGQHAEAGRQARHALQVAVDCGWEDRARRLRAEFRTSGASTGSSRRTRTGGRPVSTVTHGSARRLAALQQVSLAAATILDPDELARVALDETIRIFAAERALLFLAAGDAVAPTPHLGRGADGTDLDELTGYSATLIEQVRDTGQPIVLTSGEQGAALGSRSVLAHGLRSVMIAPLQFNGELLGLVYLDSRVAKGVFTDDDVDILTAITNHVAAAMLTARAAQRATSIEAAERRSELADTMRTSMIHISKTLDPDTVTARLLSTLVTAVRADVGVVVRADGTLLQADHSTGTADPGLVALVDTLDTPRFGTATADSPFAALLPATRSWLAVPLTSREHRVGLMLLLSASTDAYHQDGLRVAAALAEQGMIAYDNAKLFTRAEHLASTDALTGLHNRRHFFDLAQDSYRGANRHRQPLAALMIDIDHFKSVNDTHGHGAGDDVIREVAARLGSAIRGGDILGRYGGEEFALLLPGTTTEPASHLAERLRRAVTATPIATRSGPMAITISLGISQLHGQDTTIEELLGRADHALYQAKHDGRNRVAVVS